MTQQDTDRAARLNNQSDATLWLRADELLEELGECDYWGAMVAPDSEARARYEARDAAASAEYRLVTAALKLRGYET